MKIPKILQVEALTYSDSFDSIVDRNFRNRPAHRVEDNGVYDIEAMVKELGDKMIRSRQEYIIAPSGLTKQLKWATVCFALEPDLFVTAFSSRTGSGDDGYKITVTADKPERAAETIAMLRKRYAPKPEESDGPSFFILTSRSDRPQRAPLQESHLMTDEQLTLHYGSEFAAWSKSFTSGMDEPGISILCGETGTGKTSFIRHVMYSLSATHRFYFIPVDNFALLSSDSLMNFWKVEQQKHRAAQKVLVLEDAETILMNREDHERNPVSTILNLTDGLMTQFVEVHLLATLNCKRESLDKALLRPGRLRFFRDFQRLELKHAQQIAAHYGLNIAPDRSSYSLAEIFASEKFGNHTQGAKKEKAPIGFH